jgi:hypothetical protein
MIEEKFWYSPIYKMDDYGFYISEKNHKYYLNFKNKENKVTSVKISNVTFKTLKQEWR